MFVPDICFKYLDRWVLIKRHCLYYQLDGSVEFCYIAKYLEKNNI